MPVEGDVRVGEVVHEHEVVLAREVDEPLQLLRRDDRRGRVVRERDDHDARPVLLDRVGERVDAVGDRRGRRPSEPASRGATRWIG